MERTEGTDHTVDAAPKDKSVGSRKHFLPSLLHGSAVTWAGRRRRLHGRCCARIRSAPAMWGGIDGTTTLKGV